MERRPEPIAKYELPSRLVSVHGLLNLLSASGDQSRMVEVAAETRAHALRQAVNGVGDDRERRDRHPRGGEVPAGPTTVPQWQRAEKACVVSVSITDVPCEASPAVESMALPEGFEPSYQP